MREGDSPVPNRNKLTAADLPRSIRRHLDRLGLEPSRYLDWCRDHGFRPTLRKSEHALASETAAWSQECTTRALQRGRTARDPARILVRACEGSLDLKQVPHRLYDACVRVQQIADDHERRAFVTLLRAIARARFLLETRRFGTQSLSYLDGLMALAKRRADWIRSPADYALRSKNRHRQFADLLRHLLVRYPLPTFFDAAWMRTDVAAGAMRDWFVHIGRGGNLRTQDTPIPLTKRMAHHALQAPDDLSVEQALRWGQVRALRGSDVLARAVVHSSMGRDLSQDRFWLSVIRFFVAQDTTLRVTDVGPIVDFIRHQRFEPLEAVLPDGTPVTHPPPKPNFCMRGRSLERLLSEVQRWHALLGRLQGGPGAWRPCGLRGYSEVRGSKANGNLKIWRIAELNTRKLLAAEGAAMRHCVLTYAAGCKAAQYSIWSITVETATGVRRMQTVQVSGSGAIVQSRGRRNELPGPHVQIFLRRWAAREGLRVVAF